MQSTLVKLLELEKIGGVRFDSFEKDRKACFNKRVNDQVRILSDLLDVVVVVNASNYLKRQRILKNDRG